MKNVLEYNFIYRNPVVVIVVVGDGCILAHQFEPEHVGLRGPDLHRQVFIVFGSVHEHIAVDSEKLGRTLFIFIFVTSGYGS